LSPEEASHLMGNS